MVRADPNQRARDEPAQVIVVIVGQVLELKRPLAATLDDDPELRIGPGVRVAVFDVEFSGPAGRSVARRQCRRLASAAMA